MTKYRIVQVGDDIEPHYEIDYKKWYMLKWKRIGGFCFTKDTANIWLKELENKNQKT